MAAQAANASITIKIDGFFIARHLKHIWRNSGGLSSVFPPGVPFGKSKYIFRVTARNTDQDGWSTAARKIRPQLF